MAKARSPIPEGYHTLTPYLSVNDGQAAIAFYQKVFGATVGTLDTHPDGKFLKAEIKC